MYFAYLSSFAWMLLFAVDVLKTFTMSSAPSNALRGSGVGKRYAHASGCGWMLPLLMTMASVFIDIVWPSSVISPRFGREQCYFNNAYALLAWFYVPVTVVVLANVVMCTAVIVTVWRTTQETKSARGDSSSNKQLIVMSMKLTAIFGVTWLLGAIAALIGNRVFSEVAGIVSSLQGVFVSLSYVMSSRTISAVKSIRNRASFSSSRVDASIKLESIRR